MVEDFTARMPRNRHLAMPLWRRPIGLCSTLTMIMLSADAEGLTIKTAATIAGHVDSRTVNWISPSELARLGRKLRLAGDAAFRRAESGSGR